MSLSALPTELQFHILSLLDPLSYIHLTSTSHHFQSLRDNVLLASSFSALEKSNPSIFLNHDVLPCYGCLKAVAIDELVKVNSWSLYANVRDITFCSQDIPFVAGGSLAHERRCKGCDDIGAGQFYKYAFQIEAEILEAYLNEPPEWDSALGDEYIRRAGGWPEQDYDDDDDDDDDERGFEYWV